SPLHERKRALRREIPERIRALDPLERLRQENSVRALLPKLPGYDEARVVLLYASAFPEEIDTRPLIDSALERGQRVLCPRVDRTLRALRLFEIRDPSRDFQPGTLSIPEPATHCPERSASEVDWALIPGLAFNLQGFRLGRGAGHYDRLLPQLRSDCPRWALALDPQWVEDLPVEPHDQPVDGVASASRVQAVSRGSI
ncbi:MAG TPA: 5-formyltetrahydrofolate cyclo-ligase, partial [Isosphaeraceae bacterium]|nr:5-formyltetrahydrofolate cyclo-ligase [Isosphaeraceae bacterium]